MLRKIQTFHAALVAASLLFTSAECAEMIKAPMSFKKNEKLLEMLNNPTNEENPVHISAGNLMQHLDEEPTLGSLEESLSIFGRNP